MEVCGKKLMKNSIELSYFNSCQEFPKTMSSSFKFQL